MTIVLKPSHINPLRPRNARAHPRVEPKGGVSDAGGVMRRLVAMGDSAESAAIADLATKVLPNVEKQFAFIYDLSRGGFIGGGKDLAEFAGYSESEIRELPDGWLGILHPDDALAVRFAIEEVSAGAASGISQQMRVSCKDGHWEWVQLDAVVLSRATDGHVHRVAGLIQVVTPMALATQALTNESALNALCRLLVEEWADGIFLVDGTFRILYASAGAAKGNGYVQEELYNRKLEDFIDYDFARRLPKQLPRNGHKITVRAVQRRKDHSTYPVEITFRRLSGERVLVTSRDISAQQAFEDAERRQTAYYRGLFINNPSGVAVFDSTFCIKDANPALRKMVGYTDRQISQMHLAELLDADSREVMQKWRLVAGAVGRSSDDSEVMLRRRDGRSLYAHAAVTFFRDEQETEFRGLIILTDISARRQAEIDLARQWELNDKLVRECAAMIGMLDRDGRVVKVNPAVERASGYSAKELVGKLMWETGLLDPEEVPRAQARMKKLMEGAPRVAALSKARTKSGEPRIIQVQNTATWTPEGEIENFIITAVDLTEQHRLQHHLMEAVEQEQARIGHDLHDGVGQLLTGIGALTEALQLRLKGVEHEEAGRIHDLVRQAIQQVRQLSRNMSPAAVQNRDLSASLILLADMVRTSLRRQCDCEIEGEVNVTDPTKSTHLFRIAQEAINNAIRHGNPNRIQLSLKRHGPSHAVLEIANDGSSFDCRPGNEGIGLRVMQYRASMIHADLTVTCPPEGGVKVTCRFPFTPAKNPLQPKTQRQTP